MTNVKNQFKELSTVDHSTLVPRKIGAKDMEVGKVYLDKNLNRYVFLGRGYRYDPIYSPIKNLLGFEKSKGKQFWYLKLEEGKTVTKEDVEKYKTIYSNRENNIEPSAIDIFELKGYVVDFERITYKFIYEQGEDKLALEYGKLQLKGIANFHSDIKIEKLPLTFEDFNNFYRGIVIGGRSMSKNEYTRIEVFPRRLHSRLLKQGYEAVAIGTERNSLEFTSKKTFSDAELLLSHRRKTKKKSFKHEQEVFDIVFFRRDNDPLPPVFKHRKNQELIDVMPEKVFWVEAEFNEETQELSPIKDSEGNYKVAQAFEEDKEYLGALICTVEDVMKQLKLEVVYYSGQLIDKSIIQKRVSDYIHDTF